MRFFTLIATIVSAVSISAVPILKERAVGGVSWLSALLYRFISFLWYWHVIAAAFDMHRCQLHGHMHPRGIHTQQVPSTFQTFPSQRHHFCTWWWTFQLLPPYNRMQRYLHEPYGLHFRPDRFQLRIQVQFLPCRLAQPLQQLWLFTKKDIKKRQVVRLGGVCKDDDARRASMGNCLGGYINSLTWLFLVASSWPFAFCVKAIGYSFLVLHWDGKLGDGVMGNSPGYLWSIWSWR